MDIKMKPTITILYLLTFLLLSSCAPRQKWIVTEAVGKKIPVNNATESTADKSFQAFLAPLKAQLDQQMDQVIGVAAVEMRVHTPESPLSNFSADVYREVASDYLKTPVDIGIVNIKGIRTNIPAGDIPMSKVFELMPFENELVILWLKGSEVSGLLDFFASIRGEGVSGLSMAIKDGKAVNVLIGGKPVDPNKIYTIATNDYVAEGNDGMVQLTRNEKRENTGIRIRDMFIDYIKDATTKGKKISAKMDGRITII